MTTEFIVRKFNFNLLCDILDRDFGIIQCNGIIDPLCEDFKKPLNTQNNE